MVHIISAQHSICNRFLAEIRDREKQKEPDAFPAEYGKGRGNNGL